LKKSTTSSREEREREEKGTRTEEKKVLELILS
jgi:hypothetical protein